jgi:hypothetical protein
MKQQTGTKWGIYGLFFVAGIAVAVVCSSFVRQPVANSTGPARTEVVDRSRPWGRIEALKIPFADSEELFPDRAIRLQPPHWFFEGISKPQLADLLASAGLAQEQVVELLSQSRCQSLSNGWLVMPAPTLVRDLKPSSRQKIYENLARNPSNYAQQFPFRFHPGDFDSRFDGSGLSPKKLSEIESLTYTNWGVLCLADLEILPSLLNSNEFNQVIESLYRLPAYRLRLRIYSEADVATLMKYWGKGGREEKIRPFLESLARVPRTNGITIGIGYFLPEFARVRLDTFPTGWPEPQTAKEDCFWTSLNFFNAQPDMRYLDAGFVRSALRTEYDPIKGQPMFGDVVLLLTSAGDGRHACVYLADDYVFTKNGQNLLAPWVIMKMSDMLLLFASDPPLRPMILRRKEGA